MDSLHPSCRSTGSRSQRKGVHPGSEWGSFVHLCQPPLQCQCRNRQNGEHGNKIDLDEIDYLKYLIRDPETDIIGLYVEGLDKGRELMDIARSTSKPIILHKRIQGKGAAYCKAPHGALANDDKIVDAATKQAHIVRARNFDPLRTQRRSSHSCHEGKQLGHPCRSGGIAIIAADLRKVPISPIPFYSKVPESYSQLFRAKVIQPTNPSTSGIFSTRSLRQDTRTGLKS